MKLLYKPFAIIASIISSRVGHSIFRSLWSRYEEREPPKPTTAEATLSEVVGAAALEAATLAIVTATVNRAFARSFHYLTGYWPGPHRAEHGEQSD